MTKYVVYGMGISGVATARFLAQKYQNQPETEIIATDDNLQNLTRSENDFKNNFTPEKCDFEEFNLVKFQKPQDIKYDANTIISFAPGIPLYFPKTHEILNIVKKSGATLACDIEIFYRQNCQNNNNFIAITGTNGKSTTTALSGFILQKLNIAAAIGGNIGVPCFDLLQQQKNFSYIFETSSYQLDLLSQTHFKIAALLNITPDHLDRHGSMPAYIAAKKRIFRNQNAADFALIDVDNENSRQVFLELQNDKNFAASLIPVSTAKIQQNGVSLIDGKLVNNIGGVNSQLELKSEFLAGKHNDQNMAFAFAVSYCHFLQQGLSNLAQKEKAIIAAIKEFRGLRHRMQLLGEIAGIKFINDSKATNAESSAHALKACDKIFWILGGKAKEGGIAILAPYFKKIYKAYLIGEASEDFALILQKNSVVFEKCGNLENAVKKAFFDAKNVSLSQKNILLSPACASFDQWQNFEQRGDYFCKIFDELSKS
jgi:UDP-N-acetylmuramoylalanine--D-glutamate ligase